MDAELVLSLVEAEHLHAALCRALDGHPVPPSAPECRTSVETTPIDARGGSRLASIAPTRWLPLPVR
ncbi:hypothetical protein [Streptomyces yerevanensis]|uniref:hypothetical protein n=1 Tax=Streptomyces yerevanensis TaxID=66378 RepID=UPI001B803A73|nr:hypothetical protein [Streptomyces yerevanensis]